MGYQTILVDRADAIRIVTFDRSAEVGLEAEARAQARAIATDDRAEGVSAFLEKRPPRFSGT